MGYDYYSVYCGDAVLAVHMDLANALIFVKALFETYYNEPTAYTIQREERDKKYD